LVVLPRAFSSTPSAARINFRWRPVRFAGFLRSIVGVLRMLLTKTRLEPMCDLRKPKLTRRRAGGLERLPSLLITARFGRAAGLRKPFCFGEEMRADHHFAEGGDLSLNFKGGRNGLWHDEKSSFE
jgi:hypothetical protein